MAKRLRNLLILLLLACGLIGAWLWFGTRPRGPGAPHYVRYLKSYPLRTVLKDLERSGYITSAYATEVLAWATKHPMHVAVGTYELAPDMNAQKVLASLKSPVRQSVRLPETNWARRSANLLEMSQVCVAGDYLDLVGDPAEFKSKVAFPLEEPTLEGYLFPDTYDLPPLLGAQAVIERQLEAFDKKVWKALHPSDLKRTLIIASIVELETTLDSERPIVAGVIENRLAQKMPLQIDATVLYARQKWGLLTLKQIRETDSPYNTYLNKGLPPGPICSPALKSIEAAMHPAKHEYLYYVAMPDGHQLFAKSFQDHEHNIRLRKLALAALAKEHK